MPGRALGVERLHAKHVRGEANVEGSKFPISADISLDHGPTAQFYRLLTPLRAPGLWGVKGEAAGGTSMSDAVI